VFGEATLTVEKKWGAQAITQSSKVRVDSALLIGGTNFPKKVEYLVENSLPTWKILI
jgi:hypothetical protein